MLLDKPLVTIFAYVTFGVPAVFSTFWELVLDLECLSRKLISF
jgi:hypothetical protein